MSLDRTEELLAANRALRESEERFRSLVELSSDFYWETDTGHRYTAIELGWAYTGVRNNQSKIGLARWEIAHASPDEAAWETHRAAIAARERFVGFRFSRIEEGEERFYEHSGEPRYDPQGNFLGYRGVGRDVTARKRAEERYSLAVEASEEGHFDVKYDTKEHFYSDRLYELFGIAPGTRFADRAEALKQMRFYGNDAEIYASGIRAVEARNGPERYEFEFRIVLPSGEMRWLRTRGKVARDAEGNIRRRTGIAADITKAKLAEQELRESQERYALAVAGSNDGVWDVDFAARRVFISARARELAGMPPGPEVVPMEEWFASLPLHPDDAARRAEAFQAHLAGATPAYVGEFRLLQPDGAYRWRLLRGLCVRAADGKPQRMAGSISDIDARRRAEDALRLSEERYALALEAAEEGHFDVDLETGEIFVSARLNEIYGFPRQAKTANRVEFLNQVPFHPDDRHLLADIASSDWEDPARVARLERYSLRIVPRPGETRWIQTHAMVTRDAQGRARRRVGVITDITERKLAEEARRLSEERYALAMEASAEGHFDWNVQTDGIFASAHLRKMLDLPADVEYRARGDMVSRMRFYPGDGERVAEMAREVLVGSALQHEFEYRLLRGAARELRWIRARWKIFRDAHGVAQRVIGVVADITESKLAADELRESEARFRSLTELSSDWYWRQDESLRFTYSTAAINPPEGYPGGSAIGKTRWELPGIVPLSSSWAEHQALLAAHKPFRDFEYSRPAGDGTLCYLSTSGAPIFDQQGRFKGYQGIGRSITERRRIEEELRRMERLAQRLEAMGTLAGGIAHDFNNILGAILGFTEMAWREAPRGSRLQRDLESIATAGERGRALVDRILAFSRSGVGERVAVHVEQVAREALELLSAKLPSSVTLRAELRAGRAAMLGDPTQVHQVLMNLGTNAVQAMPSGGILRVSLDAVRCEAARAATVGKVAAGDYLVLRVADSGTGIAPEIRDRIFDPFFTTKEAGTGTGLGLSLVHGIVTELGGAIDLESMPGKGTAFTVHLPRSGDAVDCAGREEPDLPRGEGQCVLVVDDEEPLVQLATRALEALGYRPVGFTSSAAALAAFSADPGRFDALIADERMPGLSGTALIRKVRGRRRTIPVLLMSGYVGGAVASLAREAGADDVLKKPVLARDLATCLARVLRQ